MLGSGHQQQDRPKMNGCAVAACAAAGVIVCGLAMDAHVCVLFMGKLAPIGMLARLCREAGMGPVH